MATHPVWRGHLRLALVSCPVALHSVARASGDLHFHYINPETGHRVRMVMLDAETDEEVARRDLVRGYEFQKDHYVLLDEEDFEKARIESSSVLTITKFVDREEIAPIHFDASYYMVPDGDAGQDVYVVLRDAIAAAGRAALSRVVIARRERAVAIMPMGKGLVCHTLHEPRDLNDAAPLFDEITRDRADADMVKLARQLIDRQVGAFKPTDTEDRYETRLREVIDAKLKGEGIEPEAPEDEDRGNVVDLMAARKASLSNSAPAASASSRHNDNVPPARKAPRKGQARKASAGGRKRA
jgi:DNA end-binding protein Ku